MCRCALGSRPFRSERETVAAVAACPHHHRQLPPSPRGLELLRQRPEPSAHFHPTTSIHSSPGEIGLVNYHCANRGESIASCRPSLVVDSIANFHCTEKYATSCIVRVELEVSRSWSIWKFSSPLTISSRPMARIERSTLRARSKLVSAQAWILPSYIHVPSDCSKKKA